METKTNCSKCEIAGVGSLKRALVALCGLRRNNLTTNTIKILCVYFLHNGTLKVQNSFLNVIKIMQQVILFLNDRIVSLEGKTITFKTLGISKILYLTFLNVIPNSLIEELKKIKNTFIWHSSRPKVSHKPLCNNFENGELKYVDISSKSKNLQFSWL